MSGVEYMTLGEIAEIMGLQTSTLSNYTTRRYPILKISKHRKVPRGLQPLVRREDFETWRAAYEEQRKVEKRGRKPSKGTR